MASNKNLSLRIYISITLLLIKVLTVVLAEDGHCVWYGECNGNQYNLKQNCPFTGPAKPLNDRLGLNLLSELCPHFVQNYVNETRTCCDTDQLTSFKRNIKLAQSFLARCPSCFDNMRRHICELSCSPFQSKFMNVTEIKQNETSTYINRVDIFAAKQYIEGTYNSCKKIPVSETSMLMMDILCGNHGADGCDAFKWFNVMGDADDKPSLVPFRITYKESDNDIGPFSPMNLTFTPCNKPLNSKVPACSCFDCEESCPVPPPTSPPPEQFILFGFDGILVVMAIIFFSGTILFLLSIICCSGQNKTLVISSSNRHNHRNTEKSTTIERLGARIDKLLQIFFCKLGIICAKHPWTILILGNISISICCVGIPYMRVEFNQVKLFSSSDSRSRIEHDFFNHHFKSSYRKEQIIISSIGLPNIVHNTSHGMKTFGPVFNVTFLKKVRELEEEIKNIMTDNNHTLSDICVAPLRNAFSRSATVDDCAFESIWSYYDSHEFNESNGDYLDRFLNCTLYPHDCLPNYGGPIEPATIIGGYLPYSESPQEPSFEKATAIILTILVENHDDETKLKPALEWELKFLSFMKNWTSPEFLPAYMDVSFGSERSIEDELRYRSRSDLTIITVSYITMLAYITITLGRMRSLRQLPIDTSIILGLGGIFIVLAAIASSMGIFAVIEIPATIVAIKVMPFLVLSIGVDNIFIIVKTLQRDSQRPSETIPDHIGRILGQVGPSILMTTVSECCCFFIGGLSNTPAIRTFALHTGTALLIDFILQITCFVSLLSLDTMRQSYGRFDICCWIQRSGNNDDEKCDGILHTIFKTFYVPLLLKNSVRVSVMIIFFGWLCTSIVVLPYIKSGLDQQLVMSDESSLLKYFVSLDEYLSIGPPVYFVVKSGLNYSDTRTQNLVCRGIHCNSDSITMQIYAASQQSNVTYIVRPPSSWIDDYFEWSQLECCRYFPSNNSFCPHDHYSGSKECDIDKRNRPNAMDFQKYIPFFLNDAPDRNCVKSGLAVHSHAVNYKTNANGLSTVGASYFMSYHPVLKHPSDYYESMSEARKISDNITAMLRANLDTTVEVFPYSAFYVFFEQYLTVWSDTLKCIGISLLAIFIVTFLLTGLDILSSLIIIITITMILVNLGGLMYWWGISLNVVTHVNLIMAIGISVEFCGHLVHSFTISVKRTRIKRVKDALIHMGSTIFSGITLTKLGGIAVLAFAKSKIFQVLYFRIYLGVALIGASHGLIFMPVLLSYTGSSLNRVKRENYEEKVGRKRYNLPRKRLKAIRTIDIPSAPVNIVAEQTHL